MRDIAPDVWIVANTTWYVFNFRGRLIERLINEGYRVTVCAPADDYTGRVIALGARHLPLKFDNAGTNPVHEVIALTSMARTFITGKPSVVLSFTPKVNIYASLACSIAGVPVIANVSGLGRAFVAGGWLKLAAGLLYRLTFRIPVHVFFQNEEDRSEFIAKKLVAYERTTRLPGSGVDVDRFSPQLPRAQRTSATFLLVARMIWDKGIGEFINAARAIRNEDPSVAFHLLGPLSPGHPTAILPAELESWEQEGIVKYFGATDDVAAFYADADCVVLPSYYREGVPRTLLEAASTGLPVITTDAAGCRDAVEHEVTGYLCQPRDAFDLARQMRKFLALSGSDRQKMGNMGREKMLREFDERLVLSAYMTALSKLSIARRH